MTSSSPVPAASSVPSDPVQNSATRKQQRRRRMAGMLPTLLTLGNLVSGFAAIIAATKDPAKGLALPFGWPPLYAACMFILLGMICDGLDGSAARLTRTMSRMGAELDSLADVVTFGVAPAVIACRLVGTDVPFFSPESGNLLHKAVFGAAAVYVSCAALRLARYNVEDASPEAHGGFTGLPSPGAGGAVVGLVMLYEALGPKNYSGQDNELARGIIAVAVVAGLFLLGMAMISRLSYTHMINRAFRGKAKIMRLCAALALGWAVYVKGDYVVPACFLLYALTGPFYALWCRLRPGASKNVGRA